MTKLAIRRSLTAFASGTVWSDEALKLCDRSMFVVSHSATIAT